jgi:hypothetical protein
VRRVQVEHAALRSRGSACLALVHHRIDAVPMQDPGQRQPAEAATGDRNSHLHLFSSGLYPTIARLVIDGAHLNAEETFNHNLTTVLDGITGHSRT